MWDVQEIKDAIQHSSPETKVYIGCDSQVTRKKTIKFCTVVILHIDGKHGGRMFSNVEVEPSYMAPEKPRLRFMLEVQKVADLGMELQEVIGKRHFEVHLDLNTDPQYKSHSAVKEACGYILGTLGFNAKLKPFAFAASTAADRLAK